MSNIEIPGELARKLDRLARAEHQPRTAHIADVLWREVLRNKQREALRGSAGAWKPAGHPELAQGRHICGTDPPRSGRTLRIAQP